MSLHGADVPMIDVIGSSGWEPGRLTGRDGELQLIGELIAGISAGSSAIVIIEGPPGSGKSRLLREARRLARKQNITAKKRNFVSTVAGTHAVDLSIASEPGTQTGRVVPGTAGPELVTLDGLHSVSSAVVSGLLSLQSLANYPTVYVIASRTTRASLEETSPLAGRGDVHRINLQPLGPGMVRELAAGLLGAHPGPTLSGMLDEAEGNPLLVSELVKGLRDEQAVTIQNGVAQAGVDHFPHRVSVVVHDWMRELSENTRHFVRGAAGLGRSFTLGAAADMLGQPPSTLVPALDEALECGLISLGGDCFVFRHHLVWRVLNEASPAPAPGVHMTPRAAGPPALEPGPGPAIPPPRTPAEETARGTAPPIVPALLLAPSGLGQRLSRGVLDDVHSEVASALADGAGTDELSACRERARHIVTLFAGDAGKARRQAQLIRAADHGLDAGNVIAATVLSNLEWRAGKLSEGLRWGRDALCCVELMPRAWRPYPYLAQASKLTALGELSEAGSLIDMARTEADGLATGPAAAYVAMSYAWLLLNAGRVAEARREAEAAVSLASRPAADTASRPAMSLLARIALRSGDRSTAADLMWRCRSKLAGEHVETSRWCEYLVAAMHLAPQRAVGLLTAEYHDLLESSVLLVEDRAAAPWLVRLALAANDALLAANIADAAEKLAAANPEHHAVAVTAVHARALLEDDVESLRYAANEHRDAWAALKASEDLEAALISLGRNPGRNPGTNPARSPGRNKAVGAPTTMTMTMAPRNEPGAVEDAAADAGSRQAPDDEATRDSRPESLRDLTETEWRIARMVADGMTNRQVARSLARSSHTVNYHLRQIFRKLDLRSRVELAKHVHDNL